MHYFFLFSGFHYSLLACIDASNPSIPGNVDPDEWNLIHPDGTRFDAAWLANKIELLNSNLTKAKNLVANLSSIDQVK